MNDEHVIPSRYELQEKLDKTLRLLEESNKDARDMRDVIAMQENAYTRLDKTLSSVVNALLRQTIEGKTHGQRNTQLRQICTSIIQIQAIACDDYPFGDIPF